jgi:DedD protein
MTACTLVRYLEDPMPTAQHSATSEPTAAELELKRRGRRRLIGAVTMGIVAIVVLPMIFDAEPKRKDTTRQEIEIQIPPKEGLAPPIAPVVPPTSVVEITPKEQPKSDGKTPPPDAAADKPSLIAQAPIKPAIAVVAPVAPNVAPNVAPKGSATLDTKAEPTPVMKADAKPEKKTDTKAAEAGATQTASGGFVIQLGAFRDPENAKSVVSRMKEAKLPVFTDVLAVKNGKVTRVRVGPFPTKEKAESTLAQVKLGGVDGKVVPLP